MTSLRAGGNQAAPDLRSYQVETLAAIARELELHRSTLVVAATGTGKTVTFAARTRQGVSFGGKTLILVHRDELVKQAKRKCEEAGLWPDVEKGKLRANTLAKVVIASVQTMRGARLKRWMRTHFTEIIVDECHHAAARGYREILDYFDSAKVVGFTATPDRADGQALGEIFGSVAYRYEIKQAIADEYLVPIVARRIVVESVDLSSVAMRSGDFAQDQLAAVMGDERALRGVAVPLLELARDRLTIGFCADVAHAHAMAATMNRYRPNCARAVDGETDDEERAEILRAHAAGEYQFLFNCEVLTEGYDCLDEETEILTADGWKGRGQVRVGELVQSLNRTSGHLELAPVERYLERPLRDGERMVAVRSQHMNIRTSERHEFHVKDRKGAWQTVEGRGLVGRHEKYSLPIAAEPSAATPGLPLSDDELKLIAWFMTDGGFEKTSVCISQAKEHHDEIRALLSRLGLDFSERIRTRGGYPNARPLHVFSIPKGTHNGTLRRRGWARYAPYLDKNVSPLLHAMSVAQFDVFWAELLKGDGSNQSGKAGWLWCDRMAQVDAYTRMAIERGRSTSFTPVVTKNGKTVYRVSVRDKQWLTTDPSDKRAAKAVFEMPAVGEVVWCVTNRNSTLVTRRGGKIAIIGNCPQVACVAMIRPTKSRGRFVQCVGRGLRPFAGKSDCLLLDFTGTAGRHRLVGPVDCLLGMGEPELDDEVNDEILRLLGAVQMPLEVVTKQAEDEIGRRREAMQIAAVVRYRSEHIDPFVGDGKDSRVPPYDPKWHGEPASPGQLKVLEDEGVTLTKLPRGFSRADAWKLLAQLRGRKPSGLCSYKAAKKLTQAGVVDTRTLSAERAKELLDLLRMGDWRPSAIAREPEVRRAPALEAFA